MLRKKKQIRPDAAGGAPEWMVTFSDCMTLLLTFFVLLLTFSSFDEAIFERLKTTFADFPSVGAIPVEARDAFSPTRMVVHTSDISEGSEKPTSESGKQDGLKEETESLDFHGRKVFLVPSEKVFWAKGTAISRQGHQVLTVVAAYLKHMPGRVVVSENGPGDTTSEPFGLPRAWAVVQYLVAEQNMDKSRFSISAATTLSPDSAQGGESGAGPERILEVVLLERSIYH
jgi:chemotaxis protein MotB